MRALKNLIAEYRRCDGGLFQLSHSQVRQKEAAPMLKQMRLDELKYFFLQHSVPKTALRFPDNS